MTSKKSKIIKFFCERSGMDYSDNVKGSDLEKNELMFNALYETIIRFGVDSIFESKFEPPMTLNALSKRHPTVAGDIND